jgi:hypothetical protein
MLGFDPLDGDGGSGEDDGDGKGAHGGAESDDADAADFDMLGSANRTQQFRAAVASSSDYWAGDEPQRNAERFAEARQRRHESTTAAASEGGGAAMGGGAADGRAASPVSLGGYAAWGAMARATPSCGARGSYGGRRAALEVDTAFALSPGRDEYKRPVTTPPEHERSTAQRGRARGPPSDVAALIAAAREGQGESHDGRAGLAATATPPHDGRGAGSSAARSLSAAGSPSAAGSSSTPLTVSTGGEERSAIDMAACPALPEISMPEFPDMSKIAWPSMDGLRDRFRSTEGAEVGGMGDSAQGVTTTVARKRGGNDMGCWCQ